jgi:hypothetical protein
MKLISWVHVVGFCESSRRIESYPNQNSNYIYITDYYYHYYYCLYVHCAVFVIGLVAVDSAHK